MHGHLGARAFANSSSPALDQSSSLPRIRISDQPSTESQNGYTEGIQFITVHDGKHFQRFLEYYAPPPPERVLPVTVFSLESWEQRGSRSLAGEKQVRPSSPWEDKAF